MNRKFSIATICPDKIQKEIDDYMAQYYADPNNMYVPYIFMSDATAKAIEFETKPFNLTNYYNPLLNKHLNCEKICQFNGYKVFIDNSLKYGEVEVR